MSGPEPAYSSIGVKPCHTTAASRRAHSSRSPDGTGPILADRTVGGKPRRHRYHRLSQCSTSARRPSSGPSSRSTSRPPSRWDRPTWRARGTSACRRPPCATRWPCSSGRASSPTPTPAPGASPPTRATGSSSTTSASRSGPLEPAHKQQVQAFFTQAHGEIEQMLHDTSRLLSTSPTTPPSSSPPATRTPPCGRCSSSASAPGWRWSWPSCPTAPSRRPPSSCDDEAGPERLAAAGAHLAAHLVGLQRVRRPRPARHRRRAHRRPGRRRPHRPARVPQARGRAGLRGRGVPDGGHVRGGRHRPPGPHHPRAAVRAGQPAPGGARATTA